jgi:UrcA family protein
MSRTFKIAIAAALSAIALAPAAFADTGSKDVSVRIAYGDLDMSTAKGASTLLKRIQGAARAVCKDSIERSPLSPRAETQCRRNTVGAVVAQLDIGTLTAAWNRVQQDAVQLSAR